MKLPLQDPCCRWLDLFVIRLVYTDLPEIMLLVKALGVVVRNLHMQVYPLHILARGCSIQNMPQGLSADSQVSIRLKGV